MNIKHLKDSRVELIHNATALKNVDRIPNISHFVTWKYFDAGYNLIEALSDYDKMEKAIMRHQEIYNFDAHIEMGTRNPYLISKAMGDAHYIYDEKSEAISYVDQILCEGPELAEYGENPKKFIYEKILPRRFPDFKKENFQAALNERFKFTEYSVRVANRLRDEYGIPGFSYLMGAPIPIADLALGYRGIKGFAIDYRRYPEMIDDVCAKLGEKNFDPMLKMFRNMPDGPNMDYAFDVSILNLAHTVLSIKQYEKYFWPYLKRELDVFRDKKMTIRMLFQGNGDRFFDYLKDYQDGNIALAIENDDPAATRKALPEMAIMGGLKLETLAYSSADKCVDTVKKLVDDLGGKGLLLSEDKMGTYRNDGKAENLLAVCKFISEYKI